MRFIKWIVIFLVVSLNICFATEIDLAKQLEFGYTSSFSAENSIRIQNNVLYALHENGLEIYEINDNNELNFISRINIFNSTQIAVLGSYVFVFAEASEFDSLPKILYKIDVIDITNPIIEDQIIFEEESGYNKIDIINDKLYLYYMNNDNEYFNFIIDPITFEIIYEFSLGNIWKLNSTQGIVPQGYNRYEIYDFSNTSNPEMVGFGNINSEHESNCWNIKAINDSTLVAIEIRKLSFWDISDPYAWQHLSSIDIQDVTDRALLYKGDISIIDNYIIAHTLDKTILVDISDITNPTFVDYLEDNNQWEDAYCTSVAKDNDIFLATRNNGLKQFQINENQIELVHQYVEHYSNTWSKIYKDYLIVSTPNHTLTYYDFSDLDNIEFKGELIPNHNNSNFWINGDYLATYDMDNSNLDIFSLTNIEEPLLYNSISLDGIGYVKFDECDTTAIYIQNGYTSFIKYDISTPNNPQLCYEIDGGYNITYFQIINGYGYVLENVNNSQILHVYKNLDINQPELCSTINNIANMSFSWLFVTGNYLTLTMFTSNSQPDMGTKFISIDDPENPVVVFETDMPGRAYISDNLVFVNNSNTCYLYDISNIPTGTIEHFYSFKDVGWCMYVNPFTKDNEEYFFLTQSGNISLFEYDMTVNSPESEIQSISYSLSNYPNPFNPTTQICYYLPQDSYKASIEIYNIKGQKIKTIDCENLVLGKHNIIWNGVDTNNQSVSSGVYLYQLIIDNKTVKSSKMILVK